MRALFTSKKVSNMLFMRLILTGTVLNHPQVWTVLDEDIYLNVFVLW